MRYTRAKYDEHCQALVYRLYVTSVIQGYFQLETSYADLIGLDEREEPEIDGNEIVASFMNRGIHFKSKGSET